MSDPLIEDGNQKVTICVRGDAVRADARARCGRINRARLSERQTDQLVLAARNTLDDRIELDVRDSVLLEEAIDFLGMSGNFVA